MIQSGLGAGYGYDCVLNTGGGLGNAMTYYNLGLTFRMGRNLPNDFGNFPIRTVSSFNAAKDKQDLRYSSKKNWYSVFCRC
ncbi:MAG: lipid A-modifier LpxR family protein [Dissulfuribacterales bacterium]